MDLTAAQRDDLVTAAALSVPLFVRLHDEGPEAAAQRLVLIALASAMAYGWAYVFARARRRDLGHGLPAFVMSFALLPPGPVGWGAATLTLGFGALFGREIFGARPVLPPALVAMAFAIFAFPAGGFEAQAVLDAPADPLFVFACVAAAVVLAPRHLLAWQVAAGAAVGAAIAGWLGGTGPGLQHPLLGSFAAGALFLAAAPESAAERAAARWAHGLLVGALVVLIRTFHPEQPDGVVFAALVGGLFAPLVDRAMAWRPRRD